VEHYVIHGGVAGYDRLKVLARAHWPATSEFLDRVGVGAGTRCVDVGCGGGDVTLELARMVGSGGHVTGIDMDEVKLALARKAANERGIGNVEFRAQNVNDWNEAGAYDLVFSRLLLEHLSRPVDLLRRMWSAVAPGGAIAVEDGDFDALFCYPTNEGYEFYAAEFPETIRRHGGDPTLGRKLFAYFLEAGIPEPDLMVDQRVERDGDVKMLLVLTLDAIAETMLSDGIAPDRIRAARDDLVKIAGNSSTIVGGPRMFHTWSRRPPNAG